MHGVFFGRLRGVNEVDRFRAPFDGSFVWAAYDGEATGPSPAASTAS